MKKTANSTTQRDMRPNKVVFATTSKRASNNTPHDQPGITVWVTGRYLAVGDPDNPDQYNVQVWDLVCPQNKFNNLVITGGDEQGEGINICISDAGYGTVQYRYALAGQNFGAWIKSGLLSENDLIEP